MMSGTDQTTETTERKQAGRPRRNGAAASSTILYSRVTPGERARIEEIAAQEGKTLSEYVRDRCVPGGDDEAITAEK